MHTTVVKTINKIFTLLLKYQFLIPQIVHPYLPATQSADSTAALTQQQATNGLSTTTVASNPGTEHLYGPGDRNLMFGPTFQAAGPLLIPHHSFNAKLSQQQVRYICY